MPFSITTFLHAVLLFCTFAFTPGPNNLLCVFLGKEYGYKKTFPFMLGACLGRMVITILLVTIGEAILFRLPWEQPLLMALGSLYMLYLASKTINNGIKAKKNIIIETKPLSLWHGIALQCANVKGLLVQIALIAAYRQATYIGNLSFFLLLNLLMLATLSLWVLLGKHINPFLNKNPLANFLFNLFLGSLLAWISLRFLYSGVTDLLTFMH